MSHVTGPFFKWFGSKWLSSKKLPVPTQDQIIEPFAGSAGYSLRHYEKPGQWTANTRARISEQYTVVSHWKIDPCYEYNYQYRCKERTDYTALAGKIQKCTGQVIVCEAICSKTGAVPAWLPFEFFGNRITSRRKVNENHHSKELIYTR